MNLLHHTMQAPTSIHAVARGSFTREDAEEIAVARGGTYVELLRPDTQNTGRCKSISLENTFSTIFQLGVIRPPGSLVDHLIVTSDSGVLVILRCSTGGGWATVFTETLGKSGCRRNVPGSFVASDPLNRAFMIAALERTKMAYSFMPPSEHVDMDGGESSQEWQLSSPMQVPQNAMFTEGLCAFNVGNESPLFAALEANEQEKRLVLYQVNLGLNLLTRKSVEAVPKGVHFMHPFGSGLLLADEHRVYHHRPGLEIISSPIPQREGAQSLIVNATSVPQLALLQNAAGDLFKVLYEDGVLHLIFFDSLPPSSDILLLNSGFLFVASEHTDHALFQLDSLGPTSPCPLPLDPQPPTNLICVSTLVNYGAIAKAINVNDKWHLLKGMREGSALCTLNNSLSIVDPQVISEQCRRIYSLDGKATFFDGSSFVHAPYLKAVDTLCLGRMANGSVVQVTKSGFFAYQNDALMLEWSSPIPVQQACVSEYQLVLGAGNKMIFFELDQLNSLQELQIVSFDANITDLALAPHTKDARRGPFVAVATEDMMITLLSLNPGAMLTELVSQVCASKPLSLIATNHSGFVETESDNLYLHIVLDGGVYVRLTVDSANGELASPLTKLLPGASRVTEELGQYTFGDEQIRFKQVVIHCAHRVYLYSPKGSMQFIDGMSSLTVEGDCIYGQAEGTLTKSTWPFLSQDALYSRQQIPLSQTGRQLIYDPESNLLLVGLTNSLLIYSVPSSTFVAMIPVNAGETLTSAAIVRFASRSGGLFVGIASARDLSLMPRRCSMGVISVYLLQPDGSNPAFIHRTEFGDGEHGEIPTALICFGGKLLCSVASHLRLYDLGVLRLLLKCSTTLPFGAVTISHQGLRIAVADAQHSLLIYYYRPDDNRFFLVADDPIPRPLSLMLQLDYDTWVVVDRLGTISFLGLPAATSHEIDSDPSSSVLNMPPLLFGAPIKLQRLAHMHVGQVIVGIHSPREGCLEYVTMQGGLGSLQVIRKPSHVEALQEAYIERSVRPRSTLTASSVCLFLSRYFPAKGIIESSILSSVAEVQEALQAYIVQ
jgi:splicing factor 3B subunit 3